jgi:hypothetical protein
VTARAAAQPVAPGTLDAQERIDLLRSLLEARPGAAPSLTPDRARVLVAALKTDLAADESGALPVPDVRVARPGSGAAPRAERAAPLSGADAAVAPAADLAARLNDEHPDIAALVLRSLPVARVAAVLQAMNPHPAQRAALRLRRPAPAAARLAALAGRLTG